MCPRHDDSDDDDGDGDEYHYDAVDGDDDIGDDDDDEEEKEHSHFSMHKLLVNPLSTYICNVTCTRIYIHFKEEK